ncbi:unnamed protein product, partial [Adineta steineri]
FSPDKIYPFISSIVRVSVRFDLKNQTSSTLKYGTYLTAK